MDTVTNLFAFILAMLEYVDSNDLVFTWEGLSNQPANFHCFVANFSTLKG